MTAWITINDAPQIIGLRFRRFQGASDFSKMVAVRGLSAHADRVEQVLTLERVIESYANLSNSDPEQDMIFAEVAGEVVGYARGAWYCETPQGPYLYDSVGCVVPAWRRKGIGRALMQWVEHRQREIAKAHPPELSQFYQGFTHAHEQGLAALLEHLHFQPVRYIHDMVRPHLNDIADFLLPSGVEVRPVLPEHYRLIWDAYNRDLQGQWGFAMPTERDYQQWLASKVVFQPELWQIAWDVETDEVVGQVKAYIDRQRNQKYGTQRGYTEYISVAAPWRRKGLARALISRSLKAQKQAGMTESALNVDSENISGASRVYADCGFRTVQRNTIYRKPLRFDALTVE